MDKTELQGESPKHHKLKTEGPKTELVLKTEQTEERKSTFLSTDSETEEETDTEFPDFENKEDDIDTTEKVTYTDKVKVEVYKDKHKIGSRKACEGVITYNEPMYQSLMSGVFDKHKSTGKSKNLDNKKSKSLNTSPIKRKKINFERSLSYESAIKVKKKLLEISAVDPDTSEKICATAIGKVKKHSPDKLKKTANIVDKTKSSKQSFNFEQKKVKPKQKLEGTIKAVPKKKNWKNESEELQLPSKTESKPKLEPSKQNKGNLKKANATKTENKKKEKMAKTKLAIPQRRLKREASLNAVTFMNLLYVKEESPPKHVEHAAKRSKSETDIQVAAKKPKRHSTPEGLAAFEVTINEVIQNIRAENTIDDVIERIRTEVNTREKCSRNKSVDEVERHNLDEHCTDDDVFQKDKYDFIKIKANEAKSKEQIHIQTVKSPVKRIKKLKDIGKTSAEDIAEKKRKANLARLNKAKEILKQGKIRSMKDGTDSKEKKLLNMKLSKLSVILKRKQKKLETKKKQNGKAKDQTKSKLQKKKNDKDKQRKPKKTESETNRSARTHTEVPKRVIRPSTCQCCQSYYQNQGNSFWNNRNVMNRGSFNQDSCSRSSYNQDAFPNNVVSRQSYNSESCAGPSSELPASPTVDIHPYSSPSHVSMVDSNPFVGPLVPTHYPQCNSCTCVHGALVSAPCPQCAMGGVPVLACHHQGFGNTYPVAFSHSHGTYSHTCGCTYCTNGSYHPSSSPMIHQAIRAEAPYLVRHSVPLQLPHDSNHPLPVQLSRSERPSLPSITHQVSQVSHGDINSFHCNHIYSVPQNELSSATTVSTLVLMDQDFIDVGQDDFSENTNSDNQTSISSSDSVSNDCVKDRGTSLKNSSNKEYSSNKSSNNNTLKLKENKDKLVKPKPKRLKSTENKDKSKSEHKSEKTKLKRKHPVDTENTKIKRKKSDDSIKIDKKENIRFKKIKDEIDIKDGAVKDKNTPKETDATKQASVKTKDSANQNVEAKKQDKIKQTDALKKNDITNLKDTTKLKDTAKERDTTKQKHAMKQKDTNEQNNSLKKSKAKEEKKELKDEKKKERKKSGGNKENVQKSVNTHGWVWEGEPEVRTLTDIFDGKQVTRKCYKAIRHDDGDIIQVKDCVLVCSGARSRDMPYVAKITNFWEEPNSGEMMMTLLWYYRPEHTEGGRQSYHKDCEVFAAKHRDESPVACIDDRCYVLTYNEYCRFMAEVARTRDSFPPRNKIVPDPEEPYTCRRIPPVDLDPENVLLCRHVYDLKLKRVLKNPS